MLKENKRRNKRGFYFTIIMLIIVGIVLVFGALLIRDNLIKNTHEFGQTLVKNYASEEELVMVNFKKQIELASYNLVELKGKGAGDKEFHDWFKLYKHKVGYIMGSRISNYFGVVDGKAYSAIDNDKISYEYFKNREWYKKAIEANGETIFTGIYYDKITGKDVTTVARKMPHSNDVLAMDMAVDDAYFENNIANYVDSASFYIYDNKEKLFFYHTTWDVKGETAQKYAAKVMDHIKKYGHDSNNRIMRDKDGEVYGVYYTEMTNGGTIAMIVPVDDIMEGKKNIILSIFVFIALVIFTVVVILLMRNWNQRKNINNAISTIGLLGDMYYAIYRINLTNRTYECIKTTPDLEKILGRHGNYDFLVETLTNITINEDADYVKKFNLNQVSKKTKGSYTYYGSEFQRKFGDEYKWVNIRIIQDGDLAKGESIWCFRMVDEEKKKELENTKMLQDSLHKEEKKAQEKQEFFSKMSHDMRTPLNAIIGFSELSHSFEEDPKRLIEYMDKIGLSAKQLLTLINDILEFSKVGGKINKLTVEKFNLKETVREVEESFEENAEKAGKSITVEYEIQNSVVMGDSFKLVQILNNLVSNSLKYSNSGDSVKITVKQIFSGEHGKYQFVVEDTGIGMSQEFLKHIYEPYAREAQVLSKSETIGTGLGMLIVKNLIAIMNGDIYVQSQQGVGTTVTFTLPFKVVEEDEEPDKIHVTTKVKTQEDEQNDFFKGKKILVAEDNELNMEIVIELLKMRGAKPTKAWNGKEAVEHFKNSPVGYYDCILMDMYMPVMDGCDAARQIRQLDREDSNAIPILAVTANAFAEDIDKTTAAGMNGHISKPLDFTALYKLMKKEVKK